MTSTEEVLLKEMKSEVKRDEYHNNIQDSLRWFWLEVQMYVNDVVLLLELDHVHRQTRVDWKRWILSCRYSDVIVNRQLSRCMLRYTAHPVFQLFGYPPKPVWHDELVETILRSRQQEDGVWTHTPLPQVVAQSLRDSRGASLIAALAGPGLFEAVAQLIQVHHNDYDDVLYAAIEYGEYVSVVIIITVISTAYINRRRLDRRDTGRTWLHHALSVVLPRRRVGTQDESTAIGKFLRKVCREVCGCRQHNPNHGRSPVERG